MKLFFYLFFSLLSVTTFSQKKIFVNGTTQPGAVDTTSLSDRINLKTDSLRLRLGSDSIMQFINEIGTFAYRYKRVFNVLDYMGSGYIMGTTDATQGIQSAINECFNAGGGEVYLPNGIYIISGALQTSVNGTNPNCQIYFPSESVSNGLGPAIALVGESSPILSTGYTSTFTQPFKNTGVILKSTITGSGAYPSIIGTIGATGNYQSINTTEIIIKNITVRAYTNSGASAISISGIDLFNAATVKLSDINVTADVVNQYTQSPVNKDVVGIRIGQRNNNGPNVLERCDVSGFKYGFILGEHTILTGCYSIANYFGFVIPKGYYTVIGDILIHACPIGILFPNSATMGVAKDTAFVDLNVEYEWDVSPWVTSWYASQLAVADTGSVGMGFLKFKNATAGTGARLPISVQGGLNLKISDIADRFITTSLMGITNLFKGANVASTATIVPTGNIFHVTGTTNITSVSGTGITSGTTITIIFDGVLTFTDGSNLKLAGNFTTAADATITLVYDGTNWYETARSTN
jgi:hypothetical protein